ncbi:major facilitator superfamily domain-containing protein [Gilbertella persicaria]|uniref:major facilitator superfamily domain-containing protein n=1 Tax=Gilbertella persicaria TaxID=101096 RepID=UPI00221EFD58|nr:major facilitator superfamily domain-containing protein [Gilbertella persicaria]KAI8079712.1 major facilitator superfamily domain-containing protein [Gilbertella persicaria]
MTMMVDMDGLLFLVLFVYKSLALVLFLVGVMQDYFHQNLFENDPQAQVNLSFVGSLALIFINASSPLVQILVARYGLRPIMIMGTLFITIALEMAGFAYKIWHLYLTQGILFGIGASCMYVTVMSVTPQWFTKNRGIALGIVAGGSGMGGLILPFIVTPINRNLGPGWTYRILGFICMVCDIIACIFVRERIPRKREKKKLSDVLQFSVLKDVNFLIFSIGSDIALLGYFIPFFFVPSYATYLGMSDSQGSALVAVISALNFIGRLIAGFLADRFGRLNSNIFFTFLAAISCLLIWTFAFSYGSLMAFSAVFGLSCGSYFALMSPISASLLGMEKFPSGLSLLLLFNSITVFGSNISSAIEAATTASPYFSYKMFAGLSYLIGGFILLIVKFRINRNPFVKV